MADNQNKNITKLRLNSIMPMISSQRRAQRRSHRASRFKFRFF